MDVICKVEHGCSFGKFKEVALWREHIYFLFIKVELELVHNLKIVSCLKSCPNVCKPVVDTVFGLYSFISPMGSKSVLGNLIHPFGSNLHFNPFCFWAENGYVQTFISV